MTLLRGYSGEGLGAAGRGLRVFTTEAQRILNDHLFYGLRLFELRI
jgi:hypothetical protein